MKANLLPLLGEYNREGANLIKSDGNRILITRRKHKPDSPNKSKNFLLYVHTDGQRQYVSSLWETSTTDLYSFEYGGKRYSLDLTNSGRAEVTDNSKCP